MAGIFSAVGRATRNWWLLLITGIIFILAGVVTFIYPAQSYLTLAVFFGIAILMGGLFKVAFAITNRESLHGWGWNLASGVVDVVIGFILLGDPLISLAVLPFVVGFYILYAGGMLISLGLEGRHLHLTGAGWIVFGGVVSLLLGIGILFVPAAGVVALITFTGLSFLAEGVTYCVVALKLEKAKRRLGDLSGAGK